MRGVPNVAHRNCLQEYDLVVDIFAGSNTTGKAAEDLGRKWVSMELDADYVAGSSLRFMDHLREERVLEMFERVSNRRGRQPIDLSGPPTLFETGPAKEGSQ